jgi:hypothetical protein
LGTLLEHIQRPAPDSVRFVEVRYSKMLRKPRVVSGLLERQADGSLVRRVDVPYRETTTVHGSDVQIERDGRVRRISLAQAPALQGLMGSIDAVLGGNAAALESNFETSVEGSLERWHLALEPRERKVRSYVSSVGIDGHAAGPRCFTINEPDGDAGIIAIGAKGPGDLPVAERDGMARWCQGTQSR